MKELTSPNGKIKINIFAENSIPLYSVYADNEEIIKPSMLGLVTSIADFSQGVEITDISEITFHSEKYTLLSSKKRVCENIFNEIVVTFAKNKKEMLITLRAYDDGLHFHTQLIMTPTLKSLEKIQHILFQTKQPYGIMIATRKITNFSMLRIK